MMPGEIKSPSMLTVMEYQLLRQTHQSVNLPSGAQLLGVYGYDGHALIAVLTNGNDIVQAREILIVPASESFLSRNLIYLNRFQYFAEYPNFRSAWHYAFEVRS